MTLSALQTKSTKSPWLWISASAISLVLLGIVLAQIEWAQAATMARGLSWHYVGLAVLLLTFEGLVTAMRIWLFAGRRAFFLSQALEANAWYVLLLVVLPARLGELAAVVVLERYLGQKRGAAAMSVVTQRLYDVIVLGVFFLIALIGLSDLLGRQPLAIGAVVIVAMALIAVLRIDLALAIIASPLRKAKHRKKGLARSALRLLLQARTWTRHVFTRRDVAAALGLTTLKWACNLGGLVMLFMALHLSLTLFESLVTAAAFNFLAIIPLQTVGGLGVGEAGLTLLLTTMGLGVSIAASASIMVRIVVVLFPLLFWLVIVGGLRLRQAQRG